METLTPDGALPSAAPTPVARSGGGRLHRFANPGRFLRLSGRALPWLVGAATLALGVGLPWALFFSPPDWQQEMYYRYFMHLSHHNVYAHYGLRTPRYYHHNLLAHCEGRNWSMAGQSAASRTSFHTLTL